MTNKTIEELIAEDALDENLAWCRRARQELYGHLKTPEQVIAYMHEVEALRQRDERARNATRSTRKKKSVSASPASRKQPPVASR